MIFEFGSRTRRRPIGRDYAAVKDAEGGIKEFGSRNAAFDKLRRVKGGILKWEGGMRKGEFVGRKGSHLNY